MDFIDCRIAIGAPSEHPSLSRRICTEKSTGEWRMEEHGQYVLPFLLSQQSRLRNQQFCGGVCADDRAFDGAGEAGIDPVAGQVEPSDGCFRGRTCRLAWRKRKRGVLLADDGRA